MKRIILTIVCVIFSHVIFAQTYNMKIKQGTGSTFSETGTVDEITFENTTSFTCGNAILYGGETYPTILIGTQCWFQKNLNIGIRIHGANGQTNTPPNMIEKYCYGNNDASCTTYGGLYQWAEAMNYTASGSNVQGICPTGWHIPTQAEFASLSVFVNSNELKALGQGVGDGAGTNMRRFSALLAGYRDYYDGTFAYLINDTYFWSSTEGGAGAYFMYLNHAGSDISVATDLKEYGYSVRCLKNE